MRPTMPGDGTEEDPLLYRVENITMQTLIKNDG